MNWILFGVILLLFEKRDYATIYSMANPLPTLGKPHSLNPHILHWEAAQFDRAVLEEAHQKHLYHQEQRRKREIKPDEYGPGHIIKLNFFAHDREFRLVLRQDPSSVFSPDVEIESTDGPVNYDISRIYTGSLEDSETSQVHAVLTSDNLLDGTITTNTEHFYIEPSGRYSKDLHAAGVHTIVYKLSDVKMVPVRTSELCASEKFRKKMMVNRNITNRYKPYDSTYKKATTANYIFAKNRNIRNEYQFDNGNALFMSKRRYKRWLPEQISHNENPPLPLDLNEPYNEGFGVLDRSNIFVRRPINPNDGLNSDDRYNSNSGSSISSNSNTSYSRGRVKTARNNFNSGHGIESESAGSDIYTKQIRNRNTVVSDFNSNSNLNLRTFLTNRNILVSNYNSTILKYNHFYNNGSGSGIRVINSGVNGSGGSSSSSSTSRPSHKTHVEIITKNGATKKPNIIVNKYHPDILTSQNYNSQLNLNVRNDISDSNSFKTSYDRKSTCMLYLQADHTFFQKMGSDEASIEAITRHVQRANAIYKTTDFNGDGKPDNITFMIKRIKVHNSNALKDTTYRFPGNYGVEKFLELFSEEDYDAFCLAYMFTYRDFEMGTLGLAWTGDLKNAGGVCEKNGHYRGSLKSLNTGIVTLLNYGKHVPPAVSHVTLAHEIGHNFGSPHDPEQCTPGGEDGNFIMFARATSGDKKNNNKFSPCSLMSIEPVLNAKARSAKGCFTEPQQSICGNGVVEPGEECDCGWEEDCNDSCCYPMSRHPRSDEKPCTLTPRALCSPSQGPCCTTDCSLKFGDKCRDDNGCRDPSFCDGRMPQCPPSVNKPNKTICNKEFVCYMGECTGSICLAYGLESCQCLPGPNNPKTKSCELCCKLPGESNPCKSSFEWNEPPFDVPDMFAKPGTPCNDYNGYCDVFQKCREVDPSGPLATLRKLLLSEESLASLKKWVQNNWYTVALAIAGVIVLIILSTKLLTKKSNLKLKSVTIIHSATTETVRLPEDNNGVIVHTAVRTKVPLKKKVRGERLKRSKPVAPTATPAAATTAATTTAVTKKTTNPQQSSSTSTPTIIPPAGTANTIVTSNSKGAGVSVRKVIKRHSASSDPPKKILRKKNRVSAPVSAEEQQQAKLNEMKKNKKNKKPHSEVIDYSANTSNHTNTFTKVQKWLLESPFVTQPLSHIEHSSKVRKIISKSQSTPERLVQPSPKKTKSVGNLSSEKVKLQVMYKPPFKFSFKLLKNAAVKSHVISGGIGSSKRKSRAMDKKRVAAAPNANIGERVKRTALLIRSTETEPISNEVSEPNYETLNPKSKDNPLYENINVNLNASSNVGCDSSITPAPPHSTGQTQTSSNDNPKPCRPIMPSVEKRYSMPNPTATFRINRSASNSNLVQPPSSQSKIQASNYSRSNSLTNNTSSIAPPKNGTSVNSFNGRHLSDRSNIKESENCINLSRNFGSTQNLIQSNHGNLSKSANRNSLNLKSPNAFPSNNLASRRHGSNMNLRLDKSNSNSNLNQKLNFDLFGKPLPNGSNLARNSSNTNLKSSASSLSSTSLSRSSVSNIPRASLSSGSSHAAFARQTSLQLKPAPPAMQQHHQHHHLAAQLSQTSHHMQIPSHQYQYQQQQHHLNLHQQKPPPTPPHLPAPTLNSSINSSCSPSYSYSNVNLNFNINTFNSNNNSCPSNNQRPHTAACDENNQFEWPKLLSKNINDKSRPHGRGDKDKNKDPIPSDLEVMVSDIENLVS